MKVYYAFSENIEYENGSQN